MNISISSELFKSFPDYKMGIILVKNLDNIKRISAIESLLRGIQAQRFNEYKRKNLFEENKIIAWNNAFNKAGIDIEKSPAKHLLLMNKVLNTTLIKANNPVLDIANYYTFKYLLPINVIDLDWLCGDLELKPAQGDEPFRAYDSIEIEVAKENEPIFLDKGGVVLKSWNSTISERTKVTEKTRNVAIIVEDMSHIASDEFFNLLVEISQTVEKYVGAKISVNVLNEENQNADLGIKGRDNVDDSKISAQEKAYFIAKQQKDIELQEKQERKVTKAILPESKTSQNKKIEQASTNLQIRDKATYKEIIKEMIERALIKTFPKASTSDVELTIPQDSENGDYSTNIALKISKSLAKSPRDIAEKIKEALGSDTMISKVDVAGPGFINFYLSKQTLIQNLNNIIEQKFDYPKSNVGEDKGIIVEYSSVNIAKPFGIHHIITTILGQSIYNLYRVLGFNAVSINHVGDWGTQFGKLITAFKKWGNKEQIENDPIDELLKIYVKFHDEAEKDSSLEDEARREFKKFEDGDKENRELWKWFVDISFKDFNKTYNNLGNIHFDFTQGESFYENQLEELLIEGKERNIFVEGEEGAFVVKYDDDAIPPFVVQKKDGATLYSTRDFAALKYRIKRWQPLKILYIVGAEQTLHFNQLFTAASRFTWYHNEGEHVPYGRMHFKDKSFSTRKGNVVKLEDVLAEAEKRALDLIEKKSPDLDEKESTAKVIGVGALKYSILSQNRISDIHFDWDKVLSLDGNSAPYLQYTYARSKSILRKALNKADKQDLTSQNDFNNPKIQAVLKDLLKFKDVIIQSAQEYKPNLLANYLYELAKNYNAFYNEVRILNEQNDDLKAVLLNIVEATSIVLKSGLALLTIDVVEEM